MLKKVYGIEGFFFYDDFFTVNKKHLKSICEELVRRKIGLPWGCQTRVDAVNEEVYEIIKRAGCVQVEFGVEAGNERGWRSLRKDINEEQVVKAFTLARKKGLRTLANFMMNKPGETEEDLSDMVSLIQKIKPKIGVTNIMTPYPGTFIAESRGGIPVEDYNNLTMIDYHKFIDFLESKWRFARHDIPLVVSARKINAALRFSYKRPFGFTDWFYGWKHILLILKSERLWAYLRLFTRLVLNRIHRLTVEGFRLLKDRLAGMIGERR